MDGDSKKIETEPEGSAVPGLSEIPGFVPFNSSLDESLVDAMLAMKISDRLRTLCRYIDAVAGFRTI